MLAQIVLLWRGVALALWQFTFLAPSKKSSTKIQHWILRGCTTGIQQCWILNLTSKKSSTKIQHWILRVYRFGGKNNCAIPRNSAVLNVHVHPGLCLSFEFSQFSKIGREESANYQPHMSTIFSCPFTTSIRGQAL